MRRYDQECRPEGVLAPFLRSRCSTQLFFLQCSSKEPRQEEDEEEVRREEDDEEEEGEWKREEVEIQGR